MRLVVARRLGRRGEGLGNEILSWAKGSIASQVLDAILVGPSWGLNRRAYFRNFRTSRLDFIAEEILIRLPHYAFLENDFRATGETDFGRAIGQWATKTGLTKKKSFIVTVGGMYGGYASIHQARPFLFAKLLESQDAFRNVYKISSSLDDRKLFVAVHMRFGGDFFSMDKGSSPRGKFNIRIPGEWYRDACEALRTEFGDSIQFHFFTDCGGPEFEEAVRLFNPRQQLQRGLTECSDLILLAQADLRICSVSSYSLAASYLANAPYLWYEPQLILHKDSDRYSLWEYDKSEHAHAGFSRKDIGQSKHGTSVEDSAAPVQGYAFASGDRLPPSLVDQLRSMLAAKNRSANLLYHGLLPVASRGS